jgi:hypothetical protein
MNYNSMTDTELLHYLDLYSDDPLIQRLIGVLSRTRGALIEDLEDAGLDMDPHSWTFDDGYIKRSPGQYIQDLRHERDSAESELDLAQHELEQVVNERDQLAARSVMELIEEVNVIRKQAKATATAAQQDADRMRKENDKLREQIDMWGKMNYRH